jgi:hypothetical protein
MNHLSQGRPYTQSDNLFKDRQFSELRLDLSSLLAVVDVCDLNLCEIARCLLSIVAISLSVMKKLRPPLFFLPAPPT